MLYNYQVGNVNVHKGVQNIIEDNANDNIERMLNNSIEIDKAISDVFWKKKKTKREHCQNI